jgi:molybdate-binding protein/DNA-binding PadR family transcriptional regulator
MPAAHALLGLLGRGERYGYELRRELEDEFGPAWRMDFGQLYRLLATMTRRGWVQVRREPGEQGPDRKVYTLTAPGRAELQRWLREPGAAAERGRDEFLVKLRLGLARDTAATGELLAARRRTLEAQGEAQRILRQTAQSAHDVGRWLLAEAALRQTEAALAWLQSCAAIIPASRAATSPGREPGALIAIGSDDPLLDLLTRFLARQHPEVHFSAQPVGSLGGLLALQERRADLAGIHLLDVDSGEYNTPFVRHILPEEPVVLVNLAYREQGLLVAPGNPKGIRDLRDLARPDVRFVNRQRGSGTRLLLYLRLRQAGVDPQTIHGYDGEAPTHSAVAATITAGTADVGPGLRAVAQAWGLGFLPLGQERFDLAITRAVFDSPRLRALREVIHQTDFRQAAALLSGYDVTRLGEVIADIH